MQKSGYPLQGSILLQQLRRLLCFRYTKRTLLVGVAVPALVALVALVAALQPRVGCVWWWRLRHWISPHSTCPGVWRSCVGKCGTVWGSVWQRWPVWAVWACVGVAPVLRYCVVVCGLGVHPQHSANAAASK